MPEEVAKVQIPEKKEEQWSNKYIAIGVTACIGGLIFQLITGSLYQWGIINIYVTSYFKTIDPSLTLQSNAVAFPIMMFCMGLPMRLGIFLAEITHPLFMMLTCQILLSLSVFVSSYMTSMWVFIFFYGILFGLLVGSAFMIPIIEVNKYFPGKKNYVNGCILIGTGSGSVVFGMFSYTFLNPERLKPLVGYYLGSPQLEEIAMRVPTLLKLLALLYFCLGMLGIAMMAPVFLHNKRKEKEQMQVQKAKQAQNQRNGVVDTSSQIPPPNILNDHQAHSLAEAFCSWICWIQVAIVLLVATGLYLINGNYKTYVKKTINDDYFLTIIGAIGSLANGCSRFLWNVLFLKTGYKTVMLIILTVAICVYSTIRFTVEMKEIYFIEVFLINCCIGGLLVTTPTVAQAIYGQKTGSNIYGFYWEIVASANFIQYLFVSNLSKTIGFDNIIYICLGMAVLAVPIVIFTKFQGPWENETAALEYCVGYQDNQVQQEMDLTLEQFQHQLQIQNKRGQTHKEATKAAQETKANQQPSPSKLAKLPPLNQQYIAKTQSKTLQPLPQTHPSHNQLISPSNPNQPQIKSNQLLVRPIEEKEKTQIFEPVPQTAKVTSAIPSTQETST